MDKYSFDFRPSLIDVELNKNDEIDVFLDKIGYKSDITKYMFEDEHRPNIYYQDLKEGMHLFLYDDGPEGINDYHPYEIEITHLYGGIIFFRRIVEYPDLEEYCPKNSYMALYMMYPYEIIIKSGFEMECGCPKTVVRVDDEMSTIGSYSTTYDYKDKKRFPRI